MRTALVHEWFAGYAGSEKVCEHVLQSLPQAEVFALCDFLTGSDRNFLGGRKVRTSFIQKLPLAKKKYRAYLPLMPLAIEQFDLSSYELIVSSNHCVAKGIIRGPDQLHISYVHTPVRYAWDLQFQYLHEANLERGLKSWFARIVLHYLRQWDRAAADRVDYFLANSQYVARRIAKHYRRKSRVVYPPVEVDRFPFSAQKDDYYVAASRLVPYKKMDLIVEAFAQMPRRKLLVIGDGPDMEKVRRKAAPSTEILGYLPSDRLGEHLQRAKAFVFAAEEDFGITPVEAQACGTPVIAFGRGGATETILAGETGEFFDEQTPESLCAAVERFESRNNGYDPYRIRAQAERFSAERFRSEFLAAVDRADAMHRRMRGLKPRALNPSKAIPAVSTAGELLTPSSSTSGELSTS